MQLIRYDGGAARVVTDPWIHLADDAALPEAGDVVLSIGRLATLCAPRPGRLGVRVDGASAPEILAPHLAALALIEIEIPKFTDGRAYSLARLLRERRGYTGELRAVGHVLRDQLSYLRRCGFDSFALAAGKDPHEALGAFDELGVARRAAGARDAPAWRRP